MVKHILITACIATVAGFSQPEKPDAPLALRPRPVTISNGTLTINLNGAPAGKEWLVEVCTCKAQAFLLIADIGFEPRAQLPGHRRMSSVADWPESAIARNNSTFSIDSQSAKNNFFLYASDSTPLDGVAYLNGRQLIEPKFNFAVAILRFKVPGAGSPGPGL